MEIDLLFLDTDIDQGFVNNVPKLKLKTGQDTGGIITRVKYPWNSKLDKSHKFPGATTGKRSLILIFLIIYLS